MTRAKLPSLAAQIASVTVDDEARKRWAWFLPSLRVAGEDLLARYGIVIPRPSDADVEAARQTLADEDAVDRSREAVRRADDLRSRAETAAGRHLDLEARRLRDQEDKARAEASKVERSRAEAALTIEDDRRARSLGAEASQRELEFVHGLIVPHLTPAEVDAQAAAILQDCKEASASRKKPGVRVLLLLAHLGRGEPVSDRVVEALAAASSLTKLHTKKPERLENVTWVDNDTPLKVLGFLANLGRVATKADERDAGLALYDSVLWYRQRGKRTPGPVLNGLAALFGIVDPLTGEVNHEALSKVTGAEFDAVLKVTDFLDDFEQADLVKRKRALAFEIGGAGSLALRDTDEARVADAQAVVAAVRAGLRVSKTPLDQLVDRVPLQVLLEHATPDEEFNLALDRAQTPAPRPKARAIAKATGVPKSTADRLLANGKVDAVLEHRRLQRIQLALVAERLKAMRAGEFDKVNRRDTGLREVALADREQVLNEATAVVDDGDYELTAAYADWRRQHPKANPGERPLETRSLNDVERAKLSADLDRVQPLQGEQPDDVTAVQRAGLLSATRVERLQGLGERFEGTLQEIADSSTEPDEVRSAVALLAVIKALADLPPDVRTKLAAETRSVAEQNSKSRATGRRARP